MHYHRAHRTYEEGIFRLLLYISFAHFCVLCMSENFFAFKYKIYAYPHVMVYHEQTSKLKVIYRPNLERKQKEPFSALPVLQCSVTLFEPFKSFFYAYNLTLLHLQSCTWFHSMIQELSIPFSILHYHYLPMKTSKAWSILCELEAVIISYSFFGLIHL